MFQLIVAVISIALVAALAIASIYYGGQAFQKSSLKANVTTLVNGGQQLAGAQALYKTDNSGVADTDMQYLTNGNYLTSAPGVSGAAAAAATWGLNGDGSVASIAVNTAGSDEICAEVDNQAGANAGNGTTTDTLWNGPNITATAPVLQFGCYTDSSSIVQFGFKL